MKRRLFIVSMLPGFGLATRREQKCTAPGVRTNAKGQHVYYAGPEVETQAVIDSICRCPSHGEEIRIRDFQPSDAGVSLKSPLTFSCYGNTVEDCGGIRFGG